MGGHPPGKAQEVKAAVMMTSPVWEQGEAEARSRGPQLESLCGRRQPRSHHVGKALRGPSPWRGGRAVASAD